MAKYKTVLGLTLRNSLKMFKASERFTITNETPLAASRPTFGGSLWIRHVDCGSCNACELELAALEGPVYDAQRFGIEFTPSERQPDILTMSGWPTHNLAQSALHTVEAMPIPRIVLVGDCAINGGIFQGSYALADRPPEIKRAIIDEIPGCPPTPQQILDALCQLKLIRPKDHPSAKQPVAQDEQEKNKNE